MTVIEFPNSVFECLCAGSDGFFVLLCFGRQPEHTIGPFFTVSAALDWATENGKREGVRVDRSSFSRWGHT